MATTDAAQRTNTDDKELDTKLNRRKQNKQKNAKIIYYDTL